MHVEQKDASVSQHKAGITRIKKRADFVALSRSGNAVHTRLFVLKSGQTTPHELPAIARVGYTVSKKIGNAVERNRVKRRLRSFEREVMSDNAESGCDYVFFAKPALKNASHQELAQAMHYAFKKIRDVHA